VYKIFYPFIHTVLSAHPSSAYILCWIYIVVYQFIWFC